MDSPNQLTIRNRLNIKDQISGWIADRTSGQPRPNGRLSLCWLVVSVRAVFLACAIVDPFATPCVLDHRRGNDQQSSVRNCDAGPCLNLIHVGAHPARNSRQNIDPDGRSKLRNHAARCDQSRHGQPESGGTAATIIGRRPQHSTVPRPINHASRTMDQAVPRHVRPRIGLSTSSRSPSSFGCCIRECCVKSTGWLFWIVLLGIVALAGAIRFHLASFEFTTQPDEDIITQLVNRHLQTGSWSANWAGVRSATGPLWWSMPTYQFSPYTLTSYAVQRLFYLLGDGDKPNTNEIKLINRSFSAAAGTLTVLLAGVLPDGSSGNA